MFIDSILKIFLPKDKIFYSLFEKVGQNITWMSTHLKELVYETDKDKQLIMSVRIKDKERENYNVIHNIYIELERNFITPFDREDIYNLAQSLNKIADLIQSTAKKITFHKVNPNDIGIIKLTDLIFQSTGFIEIAINELRNMKDVSKISEALIKIKALEERSDDAFDNSIERLYNSNDKSFIEIIKMREILQILEKVSDKCEDASKVIESILIKYS